VPNLRDVIAGTLSTVLVLRVILIQAKNQENMRTARFLTCFLTKRDKSCLKLQWERLTRLRTHERRLSVAQRADVAGERARGDPPGEGR
jgi:hypothetical protein